KLFKNGMWQFHSPLAALCFWDLDNDSAFVLFCLPLNPKCSGSPIDISPLKPEQFPLASTDADCNVVQRLDSMPFHMLEDFGDFFIRKRIDLFLCDLWAEFGIAWIERHNLPFCPIIEGVGQNLKGHLL